MTYALYWKGKRLNDLGTFRTKKEAETARGIEMTQMELAEYSPAQLKKYLTIKKINSIGDSRKYIRVKSHYRKAGRRRAKVKSYLRRK